MISIARCLGLVTVVALLLGMPAVVGAEFGSLLDIPTFVFIGLGTLAIVLIGSEPSGWGGTCRVLFYSQAAAGESDYHLAASQFRLASRGAIACSVLYFLLEAMAILSDMSDPAKIGPIIRLCLLGPLYGLALSELLLHPMAVAIETKWKRTKAL
ncbi:hypothetical protein [Aeoliella mucimassa]|uniref:Flagellar motor protein PomA n=1 Tax=Aeoliella mucimassa TaxID=2527972 RepID=A0A518APV9_9BACT|nr:hypothetical protein [Aeoliella mucimassa]QDU56755.1 flagellar motor protein PomA [Aeoliella mucimassa]